VLPEVLLTARSLESLPPGIRPGSASRAPSVALGCCSPESNLQDRRIRRAVMPPARPGSGHVVGRSPGHAQGLADHGDGEVGHSADSLRNDGVFLRNDRARRRRARSFLTISWAVRRISTSIVFRPRARSSSRILA